MRRPSFALLITAAALVAGCGAKKDALAPSGSDRLRVMLDYLPNADHVGLYTARDRDEFRRAGLDVQVQTPPDPAAPLKLLQAGKVDLAISYEPELLLARDKGANLVAVAAMVQKPLTSIMAVKGSGVRSVRDLAGKTVGTAGLPYQRAYLEAITRRAGVKAVKQVDVGFNLVPAMLSKKADATLGAFWNVEGVQLRARRKKPFVLPVDRAGVPTYAELVLVARRDSLLGPRGERVRRFVQALGRGQARVRSSSAAGVSSLLREVPSLRKDRALVTTSVKATQKVFFPSDPKRPYGWQDPGLWQRYGEWMFRNKLVKKHPAAAGAVTNEFLAGEGA